MNAQLLSYLPVDYGIFKVLELNPHSQLFFIVLSLSGNMLKVGCSFSFLTTFPIA